MTIPTPRQNGKETHMRRGARLRLAGWIVGAVGILGMAKDRVFWPTIWVIELVSLLGTMFAAMSVRDALAPYALPPVVAMIGAVIAAGVVYVMSRLLLWRLTRPYASTSPARLPAWDRVRLCNIEPALLIASFIAMPQGLPFPTLELLLVALALVGGLIWFALKGPLERLNARDAARNQEQAPA